MFDWKFVVTLIASVAGVAVPIYLWRADLSSRSLIVRVVSQTALQPEVTSSLSGLKILLDGAEIQKPFLSVVELVNDGSRTIAATEYEESISILILKPAQVVRAESTESSPRDVTPKITFSDEKIAIAPLLLNPGDAITISMITSGGQPEVAVKARIAGIKSIKVEDRTKKGDSRYKQALSVLVACLLLIVYFISAISLMRPERYAFSKLGLVLAAGSSAVAASLLLRPIRDHWEAHPYHFSAAVVCLILAAAFSSIAISRRNWVSSGRA